MTPRDSRRRSLIWTAETERPTAAEMSARVARAFADIARTMPASMLSSSAAMVRDYQREQEIFLLDDSTHIKFPSILGLRLPNRPRPPATPRIGGSHVHQPAPSGIDHHRRARGRRGQRGLVVAQGGRDRAAGPAAAGRVDPRRPRRG